MQTYWHKQSLVEPLFPDLLWSQPENRAAAGKLFIVGGNAHGFAAPAEAFEAAKRAGIGTTRVLLPDSLQRTVGRVFAAGEYAPSTPSGSFSQQALAEFLDLSAWSDGALIVGDLGRNSETAIFLEQSISKYDGQLTITKDALDYFTSSPGLIVNRPATTLVLSFAQLQKIAVSTHFSVAFTFSMDMLRLIEALHQFTQAHRIALITKHLGNIFITYDGQVSTTKVSPDIKTWRVKTATHAATWWLQNPSKPFEALSTSLLESTSNSQT